MIASKPFDIDNFRGYDYHEEVESFEVDWFTFYKVQIESSDRKDELNPDDYEDEEEYIQDLWDTEAIILSLFWDKEVTEEALEKAEQL